MKINRSVKILACMLAVSALVASATGCSSVKVRLLESGQETSSSGFKRLSEKERNELGKTVVAEVQSIQGEPLELARVFGQVANLGNTPYAEAQFEVVAVGSDSEGSKSESKRVALFVTKDVNPGTLQPFEVQTTIQTGAIGELKVLIYAIK